jgi:hypothetical protein
MGHRRPLAGTLNIISSGFFEDYRDYLEEAKNPEELLFRKQYVISEINYKRKLAFMSQEKAAGATMAGSLLDPTNVVIAALAGGTLTKVGLDSLLARSGANRVLSGAVHGALSWGLFHAIETEARRTLHSSPSSPQYNIPGSMVLGAFFGGVGGYLSAAANRAKFNIKFGDRGLTDSNLFRAYDRAERKIYGGALGELDAQQQLAAFSNLEQQATDYLAGESTSAQLRFFDIGAEADRGGAIGKYMGWPVEMGAKALNRMKRWYSNQMVLLTSTLSSGRVAGMKLYATPTRESALMNDVGAHEPLINAVERQVTAAEINGHLSFKEGLARSELGRDEFNTRLLQALRSKQAYGEESNEAVKGTADAPWQGAAQCGTGTAQRGRI